MTPDIDLTSIHTIRTLAMDAVQKARSGHPGTPMALAPVAYTLWQKRLRYDVEDPLWPDRDRFVLSAGHASMLLYALLHLAGVREVDPVTGKPGGLAVSMEEIQRFRQLGSRTPGHPEHGHTPGVETTTGPLGQGVGNSVGMAIASRWLAARYNRPGFELFTHCVYALASDGDLMEGVSHEAASLAGHLALDHLCWIYDNNRITIEGSTDLAFSDDTATRFAGYGWHVEHVTDANDTAALERALGAFPRSDGKPVLIIVDSHIGWGAPHRQDTSAAHGEPLGEDEVRGAKRFYGWPEDAQFLVPDGVRERFAAGIGARGAKLHGAWRETYAGYRAKYPHEADELERMRARCLPDAWSDGIPGFAADAKGMATRESSGKVLEAVAKNLPWLIGGSADLAPSTKTLLTFEGTGTFSARDHGGRNFHFGVREHGMGAVLNGLALSGLRPYGASFLIFSDYGRPSLRLAALMGLPVIYVYTHDSIGLGEDGPTHQPIEHLMSLRAIPGLIVLRPADANEAAECWKVILPLTDRPALMALTRQALPTLDRTRFAAASGVARGAYVLADAPGGAPEVILIGTGSEVSLCLKAHETLVGDGVKCRVVSMPSWELFDQQPRDYHDAVLPPAVTARISVEAGAAFGWERWVGPAGRAIGMRSFGASAPTADLQKHFGFQPEAIVATAMELTGRGAQVAPGARRG
ncbi:MAG TPA: transketolase [Candidatus Eisenbacteria bacterium]|nr:transketolase [Candidatus Eisenbacteria bacterium]